MYDVSEEQRRRDGAEVGDGHQTAEHAQRGGQVLAHLVEVELAARRQADEAERDVVEPEEAAGLVGGEDVAAVRSGDHAEEEECGDGGEAEPGQQRAKGVRRHPDEEEEEEGGRDLVGALCDAPLKVAVKEPLAGDANAALGRLGRLGRPLRIRPAAHLARVHRHSGASLDASLVTTEDGGWRAAVAATLGGARNHHVAPHVALVQWCDGRAGCGEAHKRD